MVFLRWHYPDQVLESILSRFDLVQNSTPEATQNYE
tara:strand:- start:1479 stop:1586 length:108 start_codon:yes stop_codon:yes gene_type:complete